MDLVLQKGLQRDDAADKVSEDVDARCKRRAKAILRDLKRTNKKQFDMVMDFSPHVSALCPRRAGKSYAAASAALVTGESSPGRVTLIISLNLKQLRRLYWKSSPSGLFAIAKKYNIALEANDTHLKWTHENGSIGYLLGCDTEDQLEAIRGLEADLYVIDECKSFAPSRLQKLLDDIIDPQRASRKARVILIGTPGHILSGPFYQATEPRAKDEEEMPYLIRQGETDPHGRTAQSHLLWSFHHWSLQDNAAMPHQWEEALAKKRNKKWADDHPTWLREYIGIWAAGDEGLVFRYGLEKIMGRCMWTPKPTPENPTGLPLDKGPWRLIGGLDLGYEAPVAFCVAAYSSNARELRHVKDYSKTHMTVGAIAALIHSAQEEYGPLEAIWADPGSLGKTVLKTLVVEYGLPIETADKHEKNDYMELLNTAFADGEVFIIPDTPLEDQLLTNAWDLGDKTKAELGRLGKLKEDPNVPNDSTDAFLYLYRGSLHRFGSTKQKPGPKPGTKEHLKAWEKEQLAKHRKALKQAEKVDTRMGKFSTMVDLAPPLMRQSLQYVSQWGTLTSPSFGKSSQR